MDSPQENHFSFRCQRTPSFPFWTYTGPRILDLVYWAHVCKMVRGLKPFDYSRELRFLLYTHLPKFMRVSMVAVPAVSPTLQSGGLAMSLQSCRNLSQRLLKLRKEVPFSGAHDCQPFCLSLRKPSEFSDVHSFGFLKVPHIGTNNLLISVYSVNWCK